MNNPQAAPAPSAVLSLPDSVESRAWLAAIVESSDDAIIGKDLNGVITSWNRGAERLFGYAASEAIGRPVTMLIPPERIDEEPAILSRLRRGERIDHYETVRRRKDGTLVDISLTVSPIADASGRIVGASKIARDVTERKRAQEQVALHLSQSREMQKKLALLVEACHALMSQTDTRDTIAVLLDYARQVLTADACAVWRYDYPSQRWRVVSSEGLSEASVRELMENLPYMPPDRSILGKEPLAAEDVESTPWLAPVRHIHAREGNKSLLVAPLKLHGEYAGTIVFYYRRRQTFAPDRIQVAGALGDLAAAAITGAEVREREQKARLETERALVDLRQAEAQIRSLNEGLERKVAERTRDLTASNKELEAFCYAVSHDLRTPLRGIEGFAQLLLKSQSDRLDETGNGYLQRVCAASRRMAQLIEDLLDLSRLTRSEMRMETVDLTALARSVAADLAVAEPGRRVEFRAQEGMRASGDEKLLRVALTNLLHNAWKFTGRHPAARVELSAENHGGETVYSLRDDGAGFDMAHVGKLFQAFQRLHNVNEFPGTGIGLATVQRVIQRHGGRIWARGEVEKGAVFFFTLAPGGGEGA
jgi:PAS domain S-box-containing protein